MAICKCGCGLEFKQTTPPKLYYNSEHYRAHHKRGNLFQIDNSVPTPEKTEALRRSALFHNWKGKR